MKSKHAVAALAALAQENRLALYRLLVEAGPAGRVVGQLGEALGMPSATLSFHLKTLAQASLVEGRQEGRFIRYVANFDAMHGLVDFLTENCCGGNPAACTPLSPSPCKDCP